MGWKEIERLSQRQDRKELLAQKEDLFRRELDNPFNILKSNRETILCQSGIKDWKEELQYLKQQLSPSQKGCRDDLDKTQKKRDERNMEMVSWGNRKGNSEYYFLVQH